MPKIKRISFRRILNSHVEFTNEFIVEFEDGSSGAGAAPQGETISIYEDAIRSDPHAVIRKIQDDGYLGVFLDQESFDQYLEACITRFGRSTTYGLSLAFLNAAGRKNLFLQNSRPNEMRAPRICCNVLNGGSHAYTNPVLSDFPEYLLVARSNDIENVVVEYANVQGAVAEKLRDKEKVVVNGNVVSRFRTADNRECLDFLSDIVTGLGLRDKFDIMIDASAGDLWAGGTYCHNITDRSVWTSEGYCGFWLNLIREYGIGFLEDPFHEGDVGSWHCLSTKQDTCYVIGDNLYSSDADRITKGALVPYSHGVVIKPNQAGTISGARHAVESARAANQIIIASHRSISTEDTFISDLTCLYEIPFIKIGPLFTDYSSVLRLNEIIRILG